MQGRRFFDFNGDGLADLASANNVSNDASILLGRGDGTFALETRLTVGAAPFSVLAADLDVLTEIYYQTLVKLLA